MTLAGGAFHTKMSENGAWHPNRPTDPGAFPEKKLTLRLPPQ
jgi:hypothetical protein